MKRKGYIAQLPLKYFSDVSLELFPGKLIKGRIISSDGTSIRIDLGGAHLEAQTSRTFEKGDPVTLRVTDISRNGIALDIIDDTKQSSAGKSNPASTQVTADIQSKSARLAIIRQQIESLSRMELSTEKTIGEMSLGKLLKDLFQIPNDLDFLFITVPIQLDDNKRRHFELLARKVMDNLYDEDITTSEFLFLISTARLGDIAGKILSVGKQIRIDLTTESKSTVLELESLSEPINKALTEMGFHVSSVSVVRGRSFGPMERFVSG